MLSEIARRLLINAMLSRPEAKEVADAIDATTNGTAPPTPVAVATTPATAGTAAANIAGGVGGSTTIATTGTGGAGGGSTLTTGAGGSATAAATAATGGAGGANSVTTGAGGAEAVATVTSTGGAGGAHAVTTGAGGAVSGAVSGVATGGASGAIALASGTGGAVTATTGTNVGGASGAVSQLSGTGGAASGATDTGGASGAATFGSGVGGAGDTGGASGAVTIRSGTGGAGSGTGGASGSVTISTGAAGAGGSPAVGIIALSPGTNEKWRIDSVGNLNSVAGTPANVTADGAITATGGIAFTDVLAAWIDDSTHGAGTTSILIGNQTITTSSDSRIKKNIKDYTGSAIEALAKAPRVVTFEYDHPNWGGDRAAKGDENARLYGPNARGEFVGFIAQEMVDIFPWATNAGGGKDCPKCRAGKQCDNPDHSYWTVEYQHLVPLLVKAVQELQSQIVELRKGK